MSEPVGNPNGDKALTSIPEGIHCAAPEEPKSDRDYEKELNDLDINNLLDTLVEIALAASRRRHQQNQ